MTENLDEGRSVSRKRKQPSRAPVKRFIRVTYQMPEANGDIVIYERHAWSFSTGEARKLVLARFRNPERVQFVEEASVKMENGLPKPGPFFFEVTQAKEIGRFSSVQLSMGNGLAIGSIERENTTHHVDVFTE